MVNCDNLSITNNVILGRVIDRCAHWLWTNSARAGIALTSFKTTQLLFFMRLIFEVVCFVIIYPSLYMWLASCALFWWWWCFHTSHTRIYTLRAHQVRHAPRGLRCANNLAIHIQQQQQQEKEQWITWTFARSETQTHMRVQTRLLCFASRKKIQIANHTVIIYIYIAYMQNSQASSWWCFFFVFFILFINVRNKNSRAQKPRAALRITAIAITDRGGVIRLRTHKGRLRIIVIVLHRVVLPATPETETRRKNVCRFLTRFWLRSRGNESIIMWELYCRRIALPFQWVYFHINDTGISWVKLRTTWIHCEAKYEISI